jgi:hypothetical protein
MPILQISRTTMSNKCHSSLQKVISITDCHGTLFSERHFNLYYLTKNHINHRRSDVIRKSELIFRADVVLGLYRRVDLYTVYVDAADTEHIPSKRWYAYLQIKKAYFSIQLCVILFCYLNPSPAPHLLCNMKTPFINSSADISTL